MTSISNIKNTEIICDFPVLWRKKIFKDNSENMSQQHVIQSSIYNSTSFCLKMEMINCFRKNMLLKATFSPPKM